MTRDVANELWIARGMLSADKEIIGLGNLTQFQEVLKEGGISENTAFIWQKVARVPEDKFEVYFTETEYYGDEFTIAGLLKFAGEENYRGAEGATYSEGLRVVRDFSWDMEVGEKDGPSSKNTHRQRIIRLGQANLKKNS